MAIMLKRNTGQNHITSIIISIIKSTIKPTRKIRRIKMLRLVIYKKEVQSMKMGQTMHPVMMITLMLIKMLIRLLEKIIQVYIRIGIEDTIIMMMMNKPIEMKTLTESSNLLLREQTGLKNKLKR